MRLHYLVKLKIRLLWKS